MSEILQLADYRSRVAEIYATVRNGNDDESSWRSWVESRDVLFRTHPQSPIEEPDSFEGLSYFPYDPSLRAIGQFEAADPAPWGEFDRVGHVSFGLDDREHLLPVYWLRAYGGGLFLPFGDTTNGSHTYGGGRYLLDTVKGADLGRVEGGVLLDFNYAYHPSCTHSSRWTCPLAQPESRLNRPIEAGERLGERA